MIYVMYCTPDGIGHTSDGESITVISLDFFRQIMENNAESYTSNITFLPDGSVCYYLARPVYNAAGKKTGVIAGSVKLDEIEKMLKNLTLGESGYALLVGSNGNIITRPSQQTKYFDFYYSDKMGYKGLKELTPQIVSGTPGEGYIYLPNGDKTFISHHPVEGTDWTALIVVPVKQIQREGKILGNMIITISVIIGLAMVLFSGSYIILKLKPLKLVQQNINEIAEGEADLTKQLEIKQHNEIGALAEGFNHFVKKLQTIIGEIKHSKEALMKHNDFLQNSIEINSDSIKSIVADLKEIESQVDNQSASVVETADAVEEISQNIVSLEGMIQRQAGGVSEASAAVEEMIGNISSVNNSVNSMADSFQKLMNQTNDGITLQNDVNNRILQIENQSKTLEEANKAISNIARQTNLLAMNAAIEAAHAGESGKGFAVVADEIRKLSETSAEQTKTITQELKKVQDSIHQVVAASNESTKSFTRMSEHINTTDGLVMQIKSAMQEQQEGSKQIVGVLKDMNDTTAEVRVAAQEMTNGNKSILMEISNLRETTGSIKGSMVKISSSAEKIISTSEDLKTVSGSVHDSIDGIGKQIDLFTV